MVHRIERMPSLPDMIYKKILHLIKDDQYNIGEKLPGEKEFSKQLNVSRAALREALQKLEMDGFVDRRHGVGTFVLTTSPKLTAGLENLDSMTDLIKKQDLKPGTVAFQLTEEKADSIIANHLHLEQGETVYQFERVRTADKEPFAYDIAIASTELFKRNFAEEMRESIFSYLEEEYNIYLTHSYCNIYPENASEKLADKLHVNPGDALQVLEQVYYGKGNEPVYYGKSYIRNDVMKFHLIRRRQG